MKKLLCAIPILLICFMLLLPTVLAAGANSMALTVDSVEGSVGSTVEVAIKASVKNESNSKLDSIEFNLVYDASALRLIGAVKEDDKFVSDMLDDFDIAMDNPTEGNYRFVAASAKGSDKSGTLLTLQFEVLTEGKHELRVEDLIYSFYDTETNTQQSYSADDQTKSSGSCSACSGNN